MVVISNVKETHFLHNFWKLEYVSAYLQCSSDLVEQKRAGICFRSFKEAKINSLTFLTSLSLRKKWPYIFSRKARWFTFVCVKYRSFALHGHRLRINKVNELDLERHLLNLSPKLFFTELSNPVWFSKNGLSCSENTERLPSSSASRVILSSQSGAGLPTYWERWERNSNLQPRVYKNEASSHTLVTIALRLCKWTWYELANSSF